jgi:hypothetical protein
VVDEQPQVNAGDPLLGDGLVTETKKINDVSARELHGNGRTVIKSISNTSKERGAGTDFMIGEIRSEHTKGNTVVSDSFATSKQAYDMYKKINEAHGPNSAAPEFDLRIVGKNESGGDRIEIFKLGDKNAEQYPAFGNGKLAEAARGEFNNLANKLGVTVKYGNVAYGKATPELNVVNLPDGKFDPRTARHELLHAAFVNDISRVGFINEGFTQELLNNPEFKKQAEAASRKLYDGFGLDKILKSNPADEIITELLATKTYAEYPELKRFISDAVNIGKPIHPELLKDYPDLVKPEPPKPPTMNKGPVPKPADMAAPKPEATLTETPPPGEPPAPVGPKPYEPVMKVSGPALEEWKLAAKRNMVDPDTGVVLPQFESAAGQGFLERSVDFWNASPEAGLRAVETGELPPGTNMGTMWAAGYEYVNKLGNADMIRRFSEAKGSAQLSEAGSVLGSMGKYKIELTPVDALNKIKKEKKKFNEDVGESPLTKTKRESKIKNVENELNKAKKIDESKREEMKKKRLETKLKKFNWQIENDPQYRQKFFDEFNRARKELNAEPIPQDFKITENITLSDFLVAMQGKRTQRYRNVQEKKIAQLTDKILKRNFDRDPVNRTWIDSQTKLTRERVQKLQKTLNTLKEINAARSGEPSDAEIEKLMELYRTMQQRRADIENGRDAKPYGLAWVDYHDYINELKSRATKLRKGEIAPYILKHPIKSLKYAAGLSKALNAAYDNSYVFRQGFKTLTTNPGTWKKNAANSFRWAKQQYGGKHVMREIMADIVSQENYRNGLAVKAGLDFGNPEEPFPVSVSQNLPLVGHPYKASETMFAGQAYKTRMDLLNKYVDIANSFKPPKAIDFIAKKIFPNMDWGVDLTNKKNIQSLGKFINSLTGRGDIGKITKEQADAVNVLLFSGRFFKSNFDFLTAHQFQKGVSPFVRYQAAKNLMKAVGVVAGTMMLANFLKPGSAETDPLSSDFGKIKIGNTRFDITGGMASIVTLAARLKSMASKSTITGRTYRLNTGKYGARTGKDLIQDFIDGKLSPAASTFWNDIIGGQSKSTREKPTVSGELINLAAPLPIKNLMELLKDKNSAPILAAIIADGLGIGVNTYGGANKKSTPTRSVGGFDYTVK